LGLGRFSHPLGSHAGGVGNRSRTQLPNDAGRFWRNWLGRSKYTGQWREMVTATQDDEFHWLLAEDRIRLPDDRSLEHGEMGVEDVLDLSRVDVLPAANDQVLDPVDQG
jgi:hypothetical protein